MTSWGSINTMNFLPFIYFAFIIVEKLTLAIYVNESGSLRCLWNQTGNHENVWHHVTVDYQSSERHQVRGWWTKTCHTLRYLTVVDLNFTVHFRLCLKPCAPINSLTQQSLLWMTSTSGGTRAALTWFRQHQLPQPSPPLHLRLPWTATFRRVRDEWANHRCMCICTVDIKSVHTHVKTAGFYDKSIIK